MNDTISLTEKKAKKNKETLKANEVRNLLLKECDKEVKKKIKNQQTLINSIKTKDYIRKFNEDITINLKPKKIIYRKMNTYNLSKDFNLKQIIISPFKKEKKIKSLNKTKYPHNKNNLKNENFNLNSTKENSYIDNNKILEIKKKVCQKSLFYLYNLFINLHEDYTRQKILNEESLDELIKLNIQFFESKKKTF